MITENEMFFLLDRKVPEIRRDMNCISESGCPYKMATFFGKFTKNLISEDKTDRLMDCLALAEEMLKQGNYMVKNAVENVFVFIISRTITIKQVNKFPLIASEFNKQVYSKCIITHLRKTQKEIIKDKSGQFCIFRYLIK